MNLSTETVHTKKPTAAAPARKFMFDMSFDDATVVHRAPERKPVLMKPEQIDELKKESYDVGFAAGKQQGVDEQTAALSALVAKVDQNIATLIKCMDALAKDQEDQTRALALAVAKKILPLFTERNGTQEIESLITNTIREMEREPRLVVRVDEGQFDILNEKIQAIATQRGYAGKIIVIADAEVASGDCRIEWADGGVARNSQATWNAIENTLLPSS